MKTYFEEISSSSEDESKHSPIIFLHGILLTSKVWRKVAPMIAKKTRRKAYLLDARNHGKSMWRDEMNFDLLTADLAEFMNEHGIQRAVLVGNSMGGRTAINFALKYPQRVEILVVEDMTPRNLTSRSFMRSLFDVISHILSSYSPEMELEEMKRKVLIHIGSFFHPVYLDKEKVHKHVELEMIPVTKEEGIFKLESNIYAIKSAAESNFLVQDLPQRNLVFNGPALFIYGSKGFFNIGKDTTIKPLFPNAVIKRVEGSSHCIHLDSPYEYAEIVSEFILHHSSNNCSKY